MKIIKYYDNGNKKVEYYTNNYKNNIDDNIDNHNINGEYKEWHKNGNIRIIANFKDNKLDDIFRLYTKDNKLLYQFRYDNGRIVQGHVWFCYMDHKLLDEIELDKKLIEWQHI